MTTSEQPGSVADGSGAARLDGGARVPDRVISLCMAGAICLHTHWPLPFPCLSWHLPPCCPHPESLSRPMPVLSLTRSPPLPSRMTIAQSMQEAERAGQEFCKSKNYEYIDYEDNQNLITKMYEKTLVIIILDESGSMSGSRWKNSVNGSKDLIKYL